MSADRASYCTFMVTYNCENKQRSFFFLSEYVRSFIPTTSDLFYIQNYCWQESAEKVLAVLRPLQQREILCYHPQRGSNGGWGGSDFHVFKCRTRKTRPSCDPVRALPTQRAYGLLWFYLCGILRTNGDRGRQREDSSRGLVEEMRITTLCVCQQSFPSGCGGTLAGFFHSCASQQHKNPLSELWRPDSYCVSTVSQKIHLCANLLRHMFLRKCFCGLDYIHWRLFVFFLCDILILARSHGKEVNTKDFCINQGLRPTCC